MQIGDMQKAVAFGTEVDKGCLNRRLDIGDTTFVDVTYMRFDAGPFVIEFFKATIFIDGDTTFLAGNVVDQHLTL